MSRSPVHVRDAVPDDAAALVEVWAALVARTGESSPPPELDAAANIARIAADPDQRLLVGCVEQDVAGAVLLSRAALSPVHSDQAVYVQHLQVRDDFRRHGVGRALLEATVSWAEEKGSAYVIAAASVTSRDANRFMARLGLGQIAMVRGSTVAALRSKLPVEPPVAARVSSRHQRNVGQVLAKRRSLRRSRAGQA